MQFVDPNDQLSAVLQVDRIDSWGIYERLQQLSIPCKLTSGQPLQVQVNTAAAAVQVWSVIQQFKASRQASAERLERCWKQC
ncbi:MAG TPA: Asr1405/Asl0597 family protein [Trichocoleus sp.]